MKNDRLFESVESFLLTETNLSERIAEKIVTQKILEERKLIGDKNQLISSVEKSIYIKTHREEVAKITKEVMQKTIRQKIVINSPLVFFKQIAILSVLLVPQIYSNGALIYFGFSGNKVDSTYTISGIAGLAFLIVLFVAAFCHFQKK